MTIVPITSRKRWQQFFDGLGAHTFLHSWEWGVFQEAQGNAITRVGIFDDEKLCAFALFIKISARRATFLFCPHGPILEKGIKEAEAKSTIMSAIMQYAKNKAREEKCSFVRISPLHIDVPENRALFRTLGFFNAPMHVHSEIGWILNISSDENALLATMRKTTRNLIRRAVKEGVTIEVSSDVQDVDRFYRIYEETAKRHSFVPFSKKYAREEFEAFQPDGARWFFAVHQGTTLATALIVYTTYSGFYHQGASLVQNEKIPASYLLQWEAIKEARRRGCSQYNFWGIAPEGAKNHPWAGLTHFKKGFGGFAEAYIPTQDCIISFPRYAVNWFVERARKARRGF